MIIGFSKIILTKKSLEEHVISSKIISSVTANSIFTLELRTIYDQTTKTNKKSKDLILRLRFV